MRTLMLFAERRPWLVLALVSAITLAAIVELPGLKLEITAEGMMVEDDPARVFYQQTLETFGSENITIVFLQDDDLFHPAKLTAIREAVNKINKSPLVQETDSLFSRRYIRTVDGYIYTDPYLGSIPQTPSEAEAIRQAALRNPLIARNLLSPDGKAMAINVYFDSSKYEHGFNQAAEKVLDDALKPLRDKLQVLFHVGDPYLRTGITERIQHDQISIVPLSLLMLVITLVIALRHLAVAVIPLVTAGVSIIWTLGLMAAQGIPVNIMTSIIPALLIIIGSTEDIHLLSEYKVGLHKGYKSNIAIRFMARHMGIAISLTFVTTYFGFLSIALNDLALLRQFGLVASTGLAFNFLSTVLLVPASLKIFGARKSRQQEGNRPDIFTRLALRLLQHIKVHRLQVGVTLLLLSILAGYGALQMRVNNNVMDYFSENSSLNKYAQILHERLSGMQTFSIIVSGDADTFLQVYQLEQLQFLQQILEDSGKFDSSYSFADFMAILHSGVDSEVAAAPYLPTRDEVVREYANMLESGALRSFVSGNFGEARILVRHSISSSHELNRATAEFLDYARGWMGQDLIIQITGESYLNNRAVDYMADGQARSLALMLVVIFILVSLLFMQLKAGLIAILANVFPIIMLFGVMGYLDLALDTGTAMVAAIAMGIAVDHTMHFMVRYQRAGRVSATPLVDSVGTEATPIIATAIALAMGFATLSLSEFPPVARFGLLSAMVMLLALVSTFVITPLLLWQSRLVSVWDVLSVKVRQQVIESSPLFIGMRSWQAKKIIALSRLQSFAADEAVFLQGQEANFVRVLLEGDAVIWRHHSDGSARQINTLQPGDVFGVSALMRIRKRRADVIVTGPARALALNWQDIHQIAKIYPRVSSKLFENLSLIMGDLALKMETERPLIRDDLSGVYNATYFVDLLKFAADHSNRYDEALSLISLEIVYKDPDVDGLSWQDKANTIRKTAEAISTTLRKVDVISRWKEQMFWVALPATDASQAQKAAQRVLLKIQQLEQILDHSVEFHFQITEHKLGEEAVDLISRASKNHRNSRRSL